jgi:hypothetical protein
VKKHDAGCGVRLKALLLAAAGASLFACTSAPRPREAAIRIAKNPPATVEGRVTDPSGRPAAGLGVRGIPRGEDIPWSAPAITGCDGRFRLSVAAPAAYSFLLFWKDTAVLTPDPVDPSNVAVPVQPGQTVSGVALVFDAEAWHRATNAAPETTPSCP